MLPNETASEDKSNFREGDIGGIPHDLTSPSPSGLPRGEATTKEGAGGGGAGMGEGEAEIREIPALSTEGREALQAGHICLS